MKYFCVIGDPIHHSKSPRIHNNAIKSLGLDGIYTRYHLQDKEKLRQIFYELGLSGANITLPFKEQALKIADIQDPMALKIGAANTLVLKNSKLHAYNTDAPGFLKAIEEFKCLKKALILGAGGTAKALAHALRGEGIEVQIANRSGAKFAEFKDFPCALYEDLREFQFDLVVNSTAAGLSGDDLPCSQDLLAEILRHKPCAFEVIYGKETPFLKWCKKHQISCKDGLDMLLWQGIFAFELFFNVRDRRELLKKAMQEALK